MATAVELPQLGNTVEECLITRWVKRKGDSVSAGDIVAEIETDKTTFEITAPVDGTVLETFFEEGALVKVFSKLFVIGQPGESAGEIDPPASALRAPARHGDDVLQETASLPRRSADREGGPLPDDPRSAAFSPRAQRFAARHNVHPATIVGSGPRGRVLESDVRRAYESSRGAAPASGLRATIARRMRESLGSTAQYTLNASAAATGLIALRAKIKASRGGADVTIGDLVSFCTVRALVETPDLNAQYVDGRIVRHGDVHLAFACDTPRGLLAPVIRNAHTLSIADLAARAKALAAQAIEGTIAPDDLAGATFTISNLGALGIESFTPVINLPQVAILGVGAILVKPIRAEGRVEFVDSIGLSLTCDHQVIDGAPGARFLRSLKEKIENVEAIVRM